MVTKVSLFAWGTRMTPNPERKQSESPRYYRVWVSFKNKTFSLLLLSCSLLVWCTAGEEVDFLELFFVCLWIKNY